MSSRRLTVTKARLPPASESSPTATIAFEMTSAEERSSEGTDPAPAAPESSSISYPTTRLA